MDLLPAHATRRAVCPKYRHPAIASLKRAPHAAVFFILIALWTLVTPAAAAADPRKIRFEIAGADTIKLDGADVIVAAGGETLRLHAPLVYQESPSGRARVDGRFRLRGRHVAFEIGAYDRTRPLVIDPVVTYATYLNAGAAGVGVDGAGNIYVTTLTALLKLRADRCT